MRSSAAPDPSPVQPWALGDAASLVEAHLARQRFTLSSYGSARWLRNDPAGPREVVGDLDQGAGSIARVEKLPLPVQMRYAPLGLSFAQLSPAPMGLALLAEAWALIEQMPDLAARLRALVRSVHLLSAPDPAIDVSHSDPDLPCSVFLSLPIGGASAPLRAAESLLHEAMHLQLTLVEERWPVMADPGAGNLFSPWQQRERPLHGIVHGLYVFTAIDAFWAALLESAVIRAPARDFATRRRMEIAAEIQMLGAIQRAPGLTSFGRALVGSLLERPGHRPR